jgi:hypothetical protein
MFTTGTATDEKDLLEKLHTFLTATGSAFGLTYSGAGGGSMTAYKGGSASVAETWTITATNSTTFTVSGSQTGALANATVGTPYTGTKVQFLISAAGAAFVAGDVFTLSTAPKWTSMLRMRGCEVASNVYNTGATSPNTLIDGKKAYNSNAYYVNSTSAVPNDIVFTMREAETICEYAMTSHGTYYPNAWTFDYWNGGAWVTLDTQAAVSNAWSQSVFRTFQIASPVSATIYRIHITAAVNSSFYLYAMELRRTPGGPNAACSQYAWMAPGNDGTSQIYVGAHAFRQVDVDYYDLELAAMDSWVDGLSIFEQANRQSGLYVPLWNATMNYWFIADGRRVVCIVKGGTAQYESFYLGLYDAYGTPSQIPYPICMGGTLGTGTIREQQAWNDVNLKVAGTTERHRAFPMSGSPGLTSYGGIAYGQLRARLVSGTWQPFWAVDNDNGSWSNTATYSVWPYAGGIALLDKNLDGGYTLFPIILSGVNGLLGQLVGVTALSGQDLTAESLIRVGAVDHMAVSNITRTHVDDFFAVRLD